MLNKWKELIGSPKNYDYKKTFEFVKKYELDGFDCEVYLQANGVRPDGTVTYQRVFFAIPKNATGKLPAVVLPFYFPEATMAYDPEKKEHLPYAGYASNLMLVDLVERGFIVATADAYYRTYIDSDLDNDAWERWELAGTAIITDYPEWTGIGKLVYDTQLVIDVVEKDERVDSENIGIYGHSLGGKMAFYTGCLDDRIKVIGASDFGIVWERSNWDDVWYWGKKLEEVKKAGLNNQDLLACVAPKPFCLVAGHYDNEESKKALDTIEGYKKHKDKLFIVNHATGHKPTPYAKAAVYGYLEHYLKK